MQTQHSYADDQQGKLYLVPTPIGNLEDITIRAKRILEEADYIAAEDTRTSGIMLDRLGIHNKMELVKLMQEGATIAEISDAGMPVISDPGYILVQECIKSNVPVVPLPGPSAFATALIASGFDGQPFTYYGFLPRKASQQRPFLEEINASRATSIFYEAPHRLLKTLEQMAEVLPGGRQVVCARELTKIHEEFVRGSLEEVIQHFKEVDPRGEFVVLVSPNTEEKTLDWADLVKLVKEQVAQGVSKKDAIKQVAKSQGVSKNELYDRYHQEGAK